MCPAGSWMGAWNVCAHLEQLQVSTSMVQVEAMSLRIPTFSAAQRIPGCHLPSPAPPVEIPIPDLSQLAQMSRGTIRALVSHPTRGSACTEWEPFILDPNGIILELRQ